MLLCLIVRLAGWVVQPIKKSFVDVVVVFVLFKIFNLKCLRYYKIIYLAHRVWICFGFFGSLWAQSSERGLLDLSFA